MSIFGSIVSAIFGHASAPAAAAPTPAAPTAPSAAAPGGYAGAAAAQPMSRADVVAMIEKAVGAQSWTAASPPASSWPRNSATPALDGSAEMNIWLHKQVMAKLAEGGGRVPASLKIA